MSYVHLHLLLNHVPIVGLLFVLLLLVVAFWRRSGEMGKVALALLVGIAAVTVVVFLTGEPAEEAVENVAGVSKAIIHRHEEAADVSLIGTGMAGIVALALLAFYWRRPLPRVVMGGSLVIVLGVSGLMAWTANLGGQIRHSEIRSAASITAGEIDESHR